MIVRYWVEALADIDEIFRYLDERSPAGAHNVLQAIYRGVDDIAEQPMANRQADESGIRVKILTRYRYNIFYSIEDSAIDIIHIRHMSRKPWP